jgi:hypothetical protein
MAEQKKDYQQDPAGSPAGGDGGTFRREGPTPGDADTGRNVDDMNRKAEESIINNVTPDQTTD